MDIIEEAFKSKAVIKGGIYLFNPADALDVIKMCFEQRKKILGIDAFIVTREMTQPLMEHSIDFSIGDTSSGHWEEARSFIEKRIHSEFLFEIVYE